MTYRYYLTWKGGHSNGIGLRLQNRELETSPLFYFLACFFLFFPFGVPEIESRPYIYEAYHLLLSHITAPIFLSYRIKAAGWGGVGEPER